MTNEICSRIGPRIVAVLLSRLIAALTVCTAVEPAAAQGTSLLNEVGISANLGDQLPLDLEFVDSSGTSLRLADCFSDHPVILHFVYYECPMLCKLSADGLFSALETLTLEPGKDFSIVTLSFDPREDPALAAQAREVAISRRGPDAINRGWKFLTGDELAISTLTEAVGFRYAFDERMDQYAHASGVFVVTPDGTISRYLSGVHYSPRDLRLAIVEASTGRVGTATDQVFLLCYMYDPTSGKYGLAIMRSLRAAGIVTVIGLVAGIFTLLRRERRKNMISSDLGTESDNPLCFSQHNETVRQQMLENDSGSDGRADT